MQRAKRILALVLAFTLVASFCVTGAAAGFNAEIYSDKTLGIEITASRSYDATNPSTVSFTVVVDGEPKVSNKEILMPRVTVSFDVKADGYDVSYDCNGAYIDAGVMTVNQDNASVTVNLTSERDSAEYVIQNASTNYGTFWWIKHNAGTSAFSRTVSIYVNGVWQYDQTVWTPTELTNGGAGDQYGFRPNQELYNVEATLSPPSSLDQAANRNVSVYLTTKCPCGQSSCTCPGGSECTCSEGCTCEECVPELRDNQIDTGYGIVTYRNDGESWGIFYKLTVRVTVNGGQVFESEQFRINGSASGNLEFDVKSGYELPLNNYYTIKAHSGGASWDPILGKLTFAGVLENDKEYDNVLTIHLYTSGNTAELDVERRPGVSEYMTGYIISYTLDGQEYTHEVDDFLAAQIPSIPLGTDVTISAICEAPYEVSEWHHDYHSGEMTISGSEGQSGTNAYGNEITLKLNSTAIPRYELYVEEVREVRVPTQTELENPETGLLRENAVTIDCVNSGEEHDSQTFGLISGTYSIGPLAGNSADGYTCTLTVTNAQPYVDEYNKTESGHELVAGQGNKTITLKYVAGEWTVPTDAAPVTYNVSCDNGGGEPEGNKVISGIEKNLLLASGLASVDDDVKATFPENATYPESATSTIVFDETTQSVTLVYSITVSGEEGANYTISDPDATVISGSLTGTIPAGGSATVWVSKTFTADNISNGVLNNSATVSPGEGTNGGGSDSAEIPAEEDQGGGEEPDNPPKPDGEDVAAALEGFKVWVECENDEAGHTYQRKDYTVVADDTGARYEIGEVTGDAENGYGCTVTIKPDVYVQRFGEMNGNTAHTLTAGSPEGYDIELVYTDTGWALAENEPSSVTFYVECETETEPEGPEKPTVNDLDLGYVVRIKCVNAENTHGSDSVDFSLRTDTQIGEPYLEGGSWKVTVTVNGVDYLDGYASDTWSGVEHELAPGETAEKTFEAVHNGTGWTADATPAVTFQVVCETTGDEGDEPAITGFSKRLVTSEPTWADFSRLGISYPDARGVIHVDRYDSVTLLYTLTVSGEEGAEYLINDPDAMLVTFRDGVASVREPATNMNGEFTDTVPSPHTYYVVKTFSWADIRDSGGYLSNTAIVEPMDGTGGPDGGDGESTETVKVEIDGDWYPVVKPGRPSALTDEHVAYMIGYADGTVRPLSEITRAEVATIFFRLLTDEVRDEYWSQSNPYTDVAEDAWYNNAISTLVNMGIISGYSDGTFRPDAAITRAEFTKIAVSFFDYADDGYSGRFSDVSGGSWYATFVDAAADMGLIEGYGDGTFRPDAGITRAEACAIVNRTLGRAPEAGHLLPRSEMNTWSDNANSNAWYYADVQEATNSHDYEWVTYGGERIENWTAKLAERDWADLEREWSDAHDAPGGEVMS